MVQLFIQLFIQLFGGILLAFCGSASLSIRTSLSFPENGAMRCQVPRPYSVALLTGGLNVTSFYSTEYVYIVSKHDQIHRSIIPEIDKLMHVTMKDQARTTVPAFPRLGLYRFPTDVCISPMDTAT